MRARAGLIAFWYMAALGLGMTGLVAVATPRAAAAQAATQPITNCTSEFGAGGTAGSPASGSVAEAVYQGGSWTFACAGIIGFSVPLEVPAGRSVVLAGAGEAVTLNGGGSTQLFQVAGSLTIQGLTLENGKLTVGSPASGAAGDSGGGAIDNSGTLAVSNSIFSDNTGTAGAGAAGGDAGGAGGGAIYNSGTLTVSDSTFIGNAGAGGEGITSNTALGGAGGSGGGAIYNSGTLTVGNSTFSDNSGTAGASGDSIVQGVDPAPAGGGGGGAIYSVGRATVTNSTFSDNNGTGGDGSTLGLGSGTAGLGGGGGGAIYNGGTLTVNSSAFSGNRGAGGVGGDNSALGFAGAGGGGSGAIYNGDTLTVNNSTFSSNSGAGGGGGTASPFDSPGAVAGVGGSGGGAIYNGGALTVTNSTFGSNSGAGGVGGETSYLVDVGGVEQSFGVPGGGGGGAVYNGGTGTVTTSTFSGNSGTGGDGGLPAERFTLHLTGGTGGAGGGAIDNGQTLTVSNSTFDGNTGTGGTGGTGTDYTGRQGTGGTGGNGSGAVYNSGTLSAINATFSDGTGRAGPGGAGAAPGLTDGVDGASGNGAGNLYGGGALNNTIVANATSGANCVGGTYGGADDLEYPGTSCATPSTGGWIRGNPELALLGANGGPTATMALGIDSAARGTGDPTYCAQAPVGGFDQRGDPRSAEPGYCDIGAYQATQPPALSPEMPRYIIAPSPLAPAGSLSAGQTVSATVYAQTYDGDPAPYAPVYLSFVSTGAGSATASGGTPLATSAAVFATDSSGQVQVMYTAGPPLLDGGTDTLTASGPAGSGLASVTDSYAYARSTTVTANAIRFFGVVSPDVVVLGTDVVSGAVYDAAGSPVAGATVDLTAVSASGLGPAGSILPSVVTGPDGGFRAQYTAPDTAGSVTLTAATGSAPVVTATVEVTAGPAAAVSLALNPASVATGGSAQLTGQVSDRNGNPVSGAGIELAADGTVFSTVTTNVYGHFGPVAYMAPGTPGPVLLTASSPRVPGVPTGAVLEVTSASGSPGAPVSGFTEGTAGGVVLSSGAGAVPQVTLTATGGPGAVALVRYATDPEGVPGPDGAGVYLEAGVSAHSSFGEVTLQICGLAGSPVAYGWNGSAWVSFSPQGEVGDCLVIGPLAESALGGTSIAVASAPGAGDTLSWSPQPLAVAGSLQAGDTVSAVVYARNAAGDPMAGAAVYVSFTPVSGGGSATVGDQALGAAPQVFTADGQGQIQVTYTVPGTLPAGGTDTLTAANAASNAALSATDSYTFTTGGSGSTSGAPSSGGAVGGGGGGGSFSLAPVVSGVSPGSGPAAGGTSVTLTGSRFTGATTVSFGGTPATGFTVDSDSQITATAPVGTGTVDVTVTTPYGTSQTSFADQFTYTVAAAQSVPAAPSTPTFSDVPSTYWAYADIEALAAKGIVSGFPDGTFRPDAALTRAQFVKMLDLTLGLMIPASPAATPFTDVPSSAWYAPYVAAAAQAGIVKGTSPTTFSPAAPVTREQVAVLVARALKLTKTTPLHFTDDGMIAAWALQGVEEAVAAGYVDGFPNGTFQPLGTTTRAQAAKVLAMVLQNKGS